MMISLYSVLYNRLTARDAYLSVVLCCVRKEATDVKKSASGPPPHLQVDLNGSEFCCVLLSQEGRLLDVELELPPRTMIPPINRLGSLVASLRIDLRVSLHD
jgi:hypothetical protein